MSSPGQLSPVKVARDVLVVYRRHWLYLVATAVVILLPQALADAFLDGLQVEGVRSARDVAIVVAAPLTVVVNLMGQAVYAGFAAAAVINWRAGIPVPPLGRLVRVLPIRRLLAVDVILSIGAAIGFLLLVLPGLVFLALFGLAPVMVKFEHRGVRDSFRRSAVVVRDHFWSVLVIVGGTIFLSELTVQAIVFPFHGAGLLVAVNLAADAAVQPFEGLVIVIVALTLLEMRGEPPSPEALYGPG